MEAAGDGGGGERAGRAAGERAPRNLTAALLVAAAGFLLALALAYDPALLSRIVPAGAWEHARMRAIPGVRRAYAGLGAGLLALAALCAWVPGVARRARSPRVATALLAALAVGLPLFTLEWALEPFTHYRPTTGLFLRDDDLGWRLRPSAVERWGDQLIRTNAAGLRGPEIAPVKPAGTRRILFLGDSVTFGYRVPLRAAFPHRVEAVLRAVGRPVEAINAGVGGYSPWQYDAYLRRDGMALAPDVLVVGFVLNDVTEKFRLLQFGGSSMGVQLSRSLASFQDRLAKRSNLFHQLRQLVGRWRYGRDGVRLEELDVESLLERPDAADVQLAWKITLDNLDRLVGFAEAQGIPTLLVVFPFAFQLEPDAADPAPQAVLAAYAARRGVPLLDVLPLFRADMERRGLPPGAYFLDADHLSRAGHDLVAEAVAAAIEGRGWLEARAAGDGSG